jgi:hypothetical protein
MTANKTTTATITITTTTTRMPTTNQLAILYLKSSSLVLQPSSGLDSFNHAPPLLPI